MTTPAPIPFDWDDIGEDIGNDWDNAWDDPRRTALDDDSDSGRASTLVEWTLVSLLAVALIFTVAYFIVTVFFS